MKKTKLFKGVDITVADAQLPYAQTGVACSLNSHTSQPSHEILPSDVIYDPPIADPKWPKFSVGYQKHFKNIRKVLFLYHISVTTDGVN